MSLFLTELSSSSINQVNNTHEEMPSQVSAEDRYDVATPVLSLSVQCPKHIYSDLTRHTCTACIAGQQATSRYTS